MVRMNPTPKVGIAIEVQRKPCYGSTNTNRIGNNMHEWFHLSRMQLLFGHAVFDHQQVVNCKTAIIWSIYYVLKKKQNNLMMLEAADIQ